MSISSAKRGRLLLPALLIGGLALGTFLVSGADTVPVARASTAKGCQLFGGRLVPVGARRLHLARCLKGKTLPATARKCLLAAGIGLGVAVLSNPLTDWAAIIVARATIAGAAGACLSRIVIT